MEVKLKRIEPIQAGKMLAAFYGILSLLLVPFMVFFMAMGSFAARHHEGHAPAMPLLFGMGIGFVVVVPVFYAVMGFVFGALGAFIYNLLAKWIGGFEFGFETEEPPAPPRL
jgi:hypothetical protein